MYKNQKKEYEGYEEDQGKNMATQFAHGNIAYNIEPLSNGLVHWSAWPSRQRYLQPVFQQLELRFEKHRGFCFS